MSLNIEHVIKSGKTRLVESDSAKLDAELLLLAALKKDNRAYLYTWPDKVLSQIELKRFEDLLARRIMGEPIAHILGYKEFWGLQLNVNASTLIPRPDTEILVEQALDFAFRQQLSSGKILDLGTGTGAVALALKSELHDWNVDAVEFNPDAANLALQNSQTLELNINVMTGSWFEPLPANSRYHLIVSNPPYIENNDVHLTQGDVVYEPKSALTSGDDGLEDIKHIINNAKNYLLTQGTCFLEHGYNQGEAVRCLFKQAGYCNIKTVTDLNNQERITFAQI